MELDNVIENVQKQIKQASEFRKSFLTTFFEETESRLAMQKHDEEFMSRPAMLKTKPENNAEPHAQNMKKQAFSPQKTNKKPPAPASKPITKVKFGQPGNQMPRAMK